MPIDRCVCFDVTFTQLQQHAAAEGCDVRGLQRVFGCGKGCGLCLPYIERMLRSGQTSFPWPEPEDGSDTGESAAQRVP